MYAALQGRMWGYHRNMGRSLPKYRAESPSQSISRSREQFLRFRDSSCYPQYDGEKSLQRNGYRDESRDIDKLYRPSYYSPQRRKVSRCRADRIKRSVYRESGDYSPSCARQSHLRRVKYKQPMHASHARDHTYSYPGREYQDVPDYYIWELARSEPSQIFSDTPETFVESAGPTLRVVPGLGQMVEGMQRIAAILCVLEKRSLKMMDMDTELEEVTSFYPEEPKTSIETKPEPELITVTTKAKKETTLSTNVVSSSWQWRSRWRSRAYVMPRGAIIDVVRRPFSHSDLLTVCVKGKRKDKSSRCTESEVIMHRLNERKRHKNINELIDKLACMVPAQKTARPGKSKETKVMSLQRSLAYFCYLERKVAQLCQELNIESRNISDVTSHISTVETLCDGVQNIGPIEDFSPLDLLHTYLYVIEGFPEIREKYMVSRYQHLTSNGKESGFIEVGIDGTKWKKGQTKTEPKVTKAKPKPAVVCKAESAAVCKPEPGADDLISDFLISPPTTEQILVTSQLSPESHRFPNPLVKKNITKLNLLESSTSSKQSSKKWQKIFFRPTENNDLDPDAEEVMRCFDLLEETGRQFIMQSPEP